MDKKVYFSKMFFVERHFYEPQSVITIDLLQGEISFQRFGRKKRQMPGGMAIKTVYYKGELADVWDESVPVRMIRSGRNNRKRICLEADNEREIVFSKGIKLDEAEVKQISKYCNAEEFEPFRDREMSMDDEGFFAYRDEISMDFYGITNNHIPLIHLPMDYYYDEAHIWPSERLYRYIYRRYYGRLCTVDDVKGKKKKSGEGMSEYGALSLFGG